MAEPRKGGKLTFCDLEAMRKDKCMSFLLLISSRDLERLGLTKLKRWEKSSDEAKGCRREERRTARRFWPPYIKMGRRTSVSNTLRSRIAFSVSICFACYPKLKLSARLASVLFSGIS